MSTGGGDVHGGLYQAGRDVVVNPAPSSPPLAEYQAVPKWRSPFTQGVLSWLGVALGLGGIFPLWKLLQPAIHLFTQGIGAPVDNSGQYWWIWIFLPVVVLFGVVMSLRRVVKYQLRQPLFPGWALSGADRRITLEKIHVGDCPVCGGRMRYYNKVKRWINHIDANGKKRREVTERVPALECKRNPNHWCELDPAEIQKS